MKRATIVLAICSVLALVSTVAVSGSQRAEGSSMLTTYLKIGQRVIIRNEPAGYTIQILGDGDARELERIGSRIVDVYPDHILVDSPRPRLRRIIAADAIAEIAIPTQQPDETDRSN